MLTKLEEYKLRHYVRTYPTIKSAEAALDAAIGFELLYKRGHADEVVLQDTQQLLDMAVLLEKEIG